MLTSKNFINKISIRQIIFIGLGVRLLAVFFSPGYAFHDDHFEMPELVFRWENNINFLWTGSNVHVFSLIYPGMMYLLFGACRAAGIHRPEDMMFVVRLLHALVSLLSIYYAYLLTLRLTDRKDTAKIVALMMALFWMFPFMSVRNLREFFCIPFLLIACYHIADPKLTTRSILLAALFFAVSFSIRLQIVFIPLGIGLCLLFKKEYNKKAIVFGIACGVAYMLTQGLFDFIYYHDPFASVKEYIRFNSNPVNIEIQPQGPWYQYIGTVAGAVLGLPFFLLAWGYVYSARMSFPSVPARAGRLKMFFIASLLFFAFHSYYSNKQERFILPFLPFFILLGIIGFQEYYNKHITASWLKKTVKFIIGWFLVLNTIGLAVLTFTYSKRSRVEGMIYLRKKGDVKNIVMEGDVSLQRPPFFYLGKHLENYVLPEGGTIEQLKTEMDTSRKTAPNYVIMAGNQNFDQRLAKLKTLFPNLKQETIIETGFVDNLAHWLNPKNNQNENWYIYKVE
jgi:Alg9-like mannosyltransferase family